MCKSDDVNMIIQDSILDINRDIINDYKNINKRKDIIIGLLIVCLVGSFFYYAYKLSEFDYEDTNTVTTNANNKVFEQNSKIDSSISDIKITTK